ncbi:MAG: choice-of-anchor B family protein [Flavobacteriales bacterium]|nr:choice-of-anchor B family protein [Flavobacteriales bacterium]
MVFKKVIFSFFLFCCLNILVAQTNPLNIQQFAHIPNSGFMVPSELNDIWGWVDSSGNEYAIVGMNDGTSIIDLSDPLSPQEVLFVPGMNSIWRDIKTYGNYAYVTTEAMNGLLIIDLSNLPDSANTNTYLYTGPSNAQWQRAHNIYIDDRGYAYIFGANRGSGGAIILDLNQDPTQPVEIADINNWQVHDGMVKGDTLFLAHAGNSLFSIWDVSNPSSPVLLSQNPTVGYYSHNIWPSDDGNYIYTTEEDNGGHLSEFNITDLNNIDLTDKIQAEPGNNIMPHNAFYINDYIVNSYYTTGIQIFDVKSKGNIVNVGHFDTSPNFSGPGSNGCWGVYPYLPSGIIIASDIENGFFVLDPDYKRAAYLEGIITDASSNTSLSGVTVEILNSNNNTLSNVGGEFKLGTLNSGTFSVVFSHPLYQSDTINQVVLQNDSTTILNLVMYSLTPLNLNIESKSSALNSSLSGVDFTITNEDFTYSGTTDQNGLFTINNLIPGSYNIYAGLWSYKDFCVESLNIISDNTPFLISLEEGYRDRFNIDMGWTVNSSAASGLWERDIPTVTIYNNSDTCSPAFDSEDCGNMAFITGNLGSSPSADDVDLGYVQLVSPTISLDSNQTNYLHCNLWWRNFLGGTTPDDTLFIDVNDGVNKENLFFIHSDNPKNWYKLSLEIPNTINLSSFKIEITTADWGSGVDHLVEAGIDNLYIDNDPSSNISQVQPSLINVFPNPTPDGIVQIQGIKVPFEYSLYNISGKLVQFESNNFNKEIEILEKGIYILRIKQESKVFYKRIIF